MINSSKLPSNKEMRILADESLAHIPAQYKREDASEEDRALFTYAYCQVLQVARIKYLISVEGTI